MDISNQIDCVAFDLSVVSFASFASSEGEETASELKKELDTNSLKERLLIANTAAEMVEYSVISLLRLSEVPLEEAKGGTTYEHVYKSTWISSQKAVAKITKNFDENTKKAVLHELEINDTFPEITPRCLALEAIPASNQLRVAFEAYPISLYALMISSMFDLNIFYTVPQQISTIMAYLEKKNYMLRDFRLTKFRAILRKTS